MAQKNGSDVRESVELELDKLIDHVYAKYECECRMNYDIGSVMLFGQPGVGKTEGTRQIAQKIAQKHNYEFMDYSEILKRAQQENLSPADYVRKYKETTDRQPFVFVDFPLSMTEPVDLMGIPRVVDSSRPGSGVIYEPQQWALILSENPGILFLDELTNVQRDDVMSTAFKIMGEKRVGTLQLRKDVMVIAAGNSPKDSTIARYLPQPLLNRLSIFEVKASIDSWKDIMHERYPEVPEAFIEYTGILLEEAMKNRSEVSEEDQRSYLTPRSAEKFIKTFRAVEVLQEEKYEFTTERINEFLKTELQAAWGRDVHQVRKMTLFIEKFHLIRELLVNKNIEKVKSEIENTNVLDLTAYSLILGQHLPQTYKEMETDKEKFNALKEAITSTVSKNKQLIATYVGLLRPFAVEPTERIATAEDFTEKVKKDLNKLNIFCYAAGLINEKEYLQYRQNIEKLDKIELTRKIMDDSKQTLKIYRDFPSLFPTEVASEQFKNLVNRYTNTLATDKEIVASGVFGDDDTNEKKYRGGKKI